MLLQPGRPPSRRLLLLTAACTHPTCCQHQSATALTGLAICRSCDRRISTLRYYILMGLYLFARPVSQVRICNQNERSSQHYASPAH